MNPFLPPLRNPIGRMEYTGNVLGSVSWVALILPLFLVQRGSPDIFLRGMGAFVALVALSRLAGDTVCRLRDLDEKPAQAWLLLVPGFDLYFIGALMARPGKTTPPPRDPDIPWWQLGNMGWLQPRLALFGGVLSLVMAVGLYLYLFLTNAFARV